MGRAGINAYRGTALRWAFDADRVTVAAWLLDHGSDADLRHDFGGQGHGVQAVARTLVSRGSVYFASADQVEPKKPRKSA